jgi:hypothetical protein
MCATMTLLGASTSAVAGATSALALGNRPVEIIWLGLLATIGGSFASWAWQSPWPLLANIFVVTLQAPLMLRWPRPRADSVHGFLDTLSEWALLGAKMGAILGAACGLALWMLGTSKVKQT